MDDCIDAETQQVKPWGKAIIDRLSSYTEVSPSGTGVKIWVRASKPSNDRSRTKYEGGEVEMYDRGRYFAVTGQRLPGTPATIEGRQAEVDALYNQLFDKKEKEKPKRKTTGTQTPHGETRSLADAELVSKATAAKNGQRFARLFAGDTSDHNGDESAADQAFCSQLAFWTDKDKAQMDRTFRSSGLYRGKWDERRGETTYGQRTIDEACDFVHETYTGKRRRFSFGASQNGNDHAGGSDNGHFSRPVIILGADEFRVNSEAIDALSDAKTAPEVYQRGNLLVRVIRAHKVGKQCRFDRPEGTPSIAAMPYPFLCRLLTRVAQFCKVKDGEDGSELIPAHPPERAVAAVVARGEYPRIRGIEAVIEAPTLRPDGTILDRPGWDDETGLLYAPNADFPAVPQSPSRGEAVAAADRLLDLVRDFPFGGNSRDEQDPHRAVWLSAPLTALARHAIAGPGPLFLFDANSPGSGKTLLVDAISVISTGRLMSRTAFPSDDNEVRKQITSIALAGDRLMLFDNIEQGVSFGGAALDAALTGTTWRDRLLGKNEMTPELPLHTIWFGTGNNVTLKGDAQRRVLPCRLESREEKPEDRSGFRHPNLLEHIRNNRAQFVKDALTVLRAYIVAGSPKGDLSAFGSYEEWSRLRGCVFQQPLALKSLKTRGRRRGVAISPCRARSDFFNSL